MSRGRPMIGTPEEAAERRRQKTAERVRRHRERCRSAAAVSEPTPAAPEVGCGGMALQRLVQRIEMFEAELAGLRRVRDPAQRATARREIDASLAAVWDEVEAAGFDVPALKVLLAIRRLPDESVAVLDLYRSVVGVGASA